MQGVTNRKTLITLVSDDNDKELNADAYNDVLLSTSKEVSFGLVDETTSSICSEGDTEMTWDKLMKRYESKIRPSRLKHMGQFNTLKLNKTSKNLDLWISELELLRTRLKKMVTNTDDSYMMIHITNILPLAYDNLVESQKEKLDFRIDPLT